MNENQLNVRVMVEVRTRYGYDKLADNLIELLIPASSLTNSVSVMDALVHGMTVEVVEDAIETLKMKESERDKE